MLSVKEVTNVYDGAIASGTVTNENDDSDDGNELTDQFLAFGWASLFGQFPGSQTVELATITFIMIYLNLPLMIVLRMIQGKLQLPMIVLRMIQGKLQLPMIVFG